MNQNDAFEFDGGTVRLTDVGVALVATAKMLGSLLAAASVVAFMLLGTFVLGAYLVGFHPLGF